MLEVGSHTRLPPGVDVEAIHIGQGLLEVFGFQVAEERPVLASKEGIVGPSGLAQGLLHLRPDVAVGAFILFEKLLLDLEYKSNSFHGFSLSRTTTQSW